MLRSGYKFVLWVQQDKVAILYPDHAFYDQPGPQPDARHGRSAQPFRDHGAGAVRDRGFHGVPTDTGVYPDVLDDSGDPVPLTRIGV